MKKPSSFWISTLFFAALSAMPVLAAEEHGAHAEPSISTLFLPVVNFALFVFLFARYAWPVMRGALADRKTLVVKELAEADRAKQEAQALLAEIEARRASLGKDGERLVREMREEAERERAALLEEARKSAERIRNDARLLGEQEAARAAKVIREDIAAKVVAEVAAIVRRQLTDDDERGFVAEFVTAVESGAQ